LFIRVGRAEIVHGWRVARPTPAAATV
jgi:hypothetical protein